MLEEAFLDATRGKDQELRKTSSQHDTISPNWGVWKGKSVHEWYKYSPLDKCPRCGEYKFAYYALGKGQFIGKHKYVRGAHCRNCEFTDEVEMDPTEGAPLASSENEK